MRRQFSNSATISTGMPANAAARLNSRSITNAPIADFFIVREGPTGTCRVVETRPTDTKIVVVGNKAYKVRAEAEKEAAWNHDLRRYLPGGVMSAEQRLAVMERNAQLRAVFALARALDARDSYTARQCYRKNRTLIDPALDFKLAA